MKRKQKLIGIFMVLFAMISTSALAGGHSNHSGKITVTTATSSAKGTVYIGDDENKNSYSWECDKKSSGDKKTVAIHAKAGEKMIFEAWYKDDACTQLYQRTATTNSEEIDASSSTNNVTYYAKFIDYASASLTNGVSFTNLIVNPGFESSTWNEGWTTEGFEQHANEGKFSGNNIAQMWSNGNDNVFTSGKIYQTISNLPAGIYELKAKAVGGVDGTTSVYVTNGENTTRSIVPWREGDAAEYTTVHFVVTEDNTSVTIGFERDNQRWWTAVDDFTLTYFGQMPNDYVKSGDLSGYLYTIQDGEYVAFGRGANWETQATATNPDGLDVSVNINNYIATIKYTDMSNVYVYDAGGNNVFTDGATASQFYVQESNGKYKFILASDMSKALGVGTDVYNNAHEGFTPTGEDVPVIKIVDAANAPVWKFADTGVTMVIGKTKPYGTFVAPFDVTLPEGVTAYQVSEIADNGVISLTSSFTGLDGRTLAAGTPVIVEKNAELNETIYGTTNTSITSDVNSNGYLVGMYAGDVAADSYIPYGSAYVLQKKSTDTEPKFYKVAENKVHKVAYRAYLYNPANIEIKAIKVVEDGEVSAVSSVDIEATVVAIYSVSGAKINAMQKGLNVVKMSDGSIKKILVK